MPVRLNITIDEDVHERLKQELPAKGITGSSTTQSGRDSALRETLSTKPTRPRPANDGGTPRPVTGAP